MLFKLICIEFETFILLAWLSLWTRSRLYNHSCKNTHSARTKEKNQVIILYLCKYWHLFF